MAGGDRSVSMLVGLQKVHSFLWLGIVGDVPFSSEALILGLVTDSGVPLLVVAGPGVFFGKNCPAYLVGRVNGCLC